MGNNNTLKPNKDINMIFPSVNQGGDHTLSSTEMISLLLDNYSDHRGLPNDVTRTIERMAISTPDYVLNEDRMGSGRKSWHPILKYDINTEDNPLLWEEFTGQKPPTKKPTFKLNLVDSCKGNDINNFYNNDDYDPGGDGFSFMGNINPEISVF